MEHVQLLKKGALVAQDPENYEHLKGEFALDEVEKKVLAEEITHRWRIPTRLFLTIATCSIGAAVQGWDQTGSNGANLFFPEIYGIGSSSVHDRLVSLDRLSLPNEISC